MKVGDIVAVSKFGERFRVTAIRAAPPMQRAPLLLQLRSTIDSYTIHDYPSSLVTKEEQ